MPSLSPGARSPFPPTLGVEAGSGTSESGTRSSRASSTTRAVPRDSSNEGSSQGLASLQIAAPGSTTNEAGADFEKSNALTALQVLQVPP